MTGLVIAVIGGGLFLFAYGIILWRVLGQRLDRIEQWERWIVKLQKQIKELQKAGTAPRDLYWNRQITDLQQASKRQAEFCQILVPLARWLVHAREAAEQALTSPDKDMPSWEDLTARPVAPFGTGVTYTP